MNPTTLECISTGLIAIPCIAAIAVCAWLMIKDWLKASRRCPYTDYRCQYMYCQRQKRR